MTRAIYVRTSTEDQHGKAQHGACYHAAAARGWDREDGAGVELYQDIGHSGAKASRPELDRLRRDVARGRVREVLVFALDRLGRSLLNVVQLLTEFTAAGCAVVSLREALDFTTPAGRLQAQLLAAFAEFERECIRDRVRSGIKAARARGVTLGRRKRVLSWTVHELRDMVDGVGSVRAVARKLGLPEATLRRALAGAPETPPKSAVGDHGKTAGYGESI